MRIGVVLAPTDPWRYFQDTFDYLKSLYQVDVFRARQLRTPFLEHRVNRQLFRHDLNRFLETHDVVFFEWASELLAAASSLPKSARIITRIHRYEVFEHLARVNWDVVDRVILVSRAMRRKFSDRLPDQGHKTVVVPEAVSTDRFRPAPKAFSGDLGTLCYLIPRKRVYELILAFHRLLEGGAVSHLHLGGGRHHAYEDYYDALLGLIRKLNLQERVTLYGDVVEPWSWYSRIDLFVSNSYSEGLQVAPMEAMASGRYALSHWWDGAEDLLPERNLFITDAQLQERVMEYCAASESVKLQRQEEMRAIARERFDAAIINARICGIIEEVAAGAGLAQQSPEAEFPSGERRKVVGVR